jgi:acetoin utilization deacetylase AcuC-like enzyme
MKAFYTDLFVLPLPDGHRFPMEKYSLLRERVERSEIVRDEDLQVPAAATDVELGRVHDRQYIQRVTTGELDRKEVRRIGFPWSPELIERSRRSTGATMAACRAAIQEGIAVNLAGGTHHAHAGFGEGFCVFNDSAVAARAMQAEGRVSRVVILDCDVHQGNGTASIFRGDPTVFTFSIHGDGNFPFEKEESDLDLALQDGADDARYLEALNCGLQQSLDRSRAELAIYLAGADPHERDRLGRLSVTREGLGQRDGMVFDACRGRGIPVAVSMAGGYGADVEETVDIHFETVRRAAMA